MIFTFIEKQKDVTLWNKLHGGDIMAMNDTDSVAQCACVALVPTFLHPFGQQWGRTRAEIYTRVQFYEGS